MSLGTRIAETAGDVAVASKRQAQRVQLRLAGLRMESKVRPELAALGSEFVALIESGAIQVDAPDVHAHMATIARLRGEFESKQTAFEQIGRDADRAKRAETSMAKVDANAKVEAAVAQSASDAAAEAAGSPPEEGGEG